MEDEGDANAEVTVLIAEASIARCHASSRDLRGRGECQDNIVRKHIEIIHCSCS